MCASRRSGESCGLRDHLTVHRGYDARAELADAGGVRVLVALGAYSLIREIALFVDGDRTGLVRKDVARSDMPRRQLRITFDLSGFRLRCTVWLPPSRNNKLGALRATQLQLVPSQ